MNKNMNVGIVGYGFVGKALAASFNDKVNLLCIDPKLGNNVTHLLKFNPQIIFVCVPTPMTDDGNQDLSILRNVASNLSELCPDKLIVLKSSVTPNHVKDIESRVKRFVYNPEFLKEKSATEDFINSSLIIFGGDIENSKELGKFYNKYTKCIQKEYTYTDVISASLVKYSISSYLATKVTFFNELNTIFEKSGTNETWQSFINILNKDLRVGSSHMDVPGHDGRKGFGGACFPKDTQAFLKFSEALGSSFNLLKSTININNKIRSSYNDVVEREKEQNIKFGDS